MNRVDFLKQLESLLQNISPAEREEALQYYNDYFDDAGEENEQSVLEALGTPAKVAENIKRDLYGSGYGDNTYQRAPVGDRAVVRYQPVKAEPPKQDNKLSAGWIALIVVLCVFASPIILSVGAGVLGTLLGLAATWFGLILGFGVTALALIAVMLVLLVVGIMCMVYSPLVGVGVIGGGFICGGLGILFLMLTVAMAGIATPAICQGIVWICRKLFGKNQPECGKA